MSNKRKPLLKRLQDSAQDIDGDFFSDHPTTTHYTRPATPDELKATGYPPGTVVFVQRFGVQRIRAFAPPNERAN